MRPECTEAPRIRDGPRNGRIRAFAFMGEPHAPPYPKSEREIIAPDSRNL